jgi:hypothetical protein
MILPPVKTIHLVTSGSAIADRMGPHATKYNDTQHNDTQHNDTQHNDTQLNATQHNANQHNDSQGNDPQYKGFATQHK